MIDIESPIFENLINDLMDKNWALVPFLFSGETLGQLQQNLLHKLHADELKSAGIGNQTHLQTVETIRNDKIHWIENDSQEPSELDFLNTVAILSQYLNQTCYTGIQTHEFHYACFSAGAFYKRHIDRFRNDNARKFSMVSYLNPQWSESDGGHLVLYTEAGDIRIKPEFGHTVIFKSDLLEHEVLPATKDRLSITGWLK